MPRIFPTTAISITHTAARINNIYIAYNNNLKYVTLVQGVYRLRKPLAYSFKK